MRILSGIQPSGSLHLGNYFGMMKKMIEYQEHEELFCFIANYHAMTSVAEGKALAQGTLEAAANFLALGMDPERSTVLGAVGPPRGAGADLVPFHLHPHGAA
jgi:tryptophanyl-tRNA synthetase